MNAILAFVALMIASFACFALDDASDSCDAASANDARFALIASKLPLAGASLVPFQMLANESRPNPKEQKAIAEYVSAHRECVRRAEAFRTRNPAHINAMLSEGENKIIAAFVDLYNKKLTYGAANRRLQAINDDYRIKIAFAMEQIRSGQAAAQQAERDRQTAAQQAERDRQAAQARDEAAQRAAQAQYEDAQRQADARQKDAIRQQLLLQMLQKPAVTYQPLVPYQMPTRPSTSMPVNPSTTTRCSWVGSQWTCYSN